MGNSAAKESRPPSTRSRPGSVRHASMPNSPSAPLPQTSADRLVGTMYGTRTGRGSRPDLSFLHLGSSDRAATPPVETRRETKQEREARKAEKERAARETERERSMLEEGVDGGYLVTLGTYTGPEDFSKPVVRQLMIERRLAPFWKGLNDHSDAWTEFQLVSAARGLPIPAADAIPPDMEGSPSPANNAQDVKTLTVPISSRSQSSQSDTSANLSASHPAFSHLGASSPGSSPLFRARAKTLASMSTSSKLVPPSPQQLIPQEISLPRDPFVNGQPVEAYLYKDASECPICFLYYPPYLNRTRCCDQSICSECFVQIKRPDPHQPEHHEDPSAPSEPKPPADEEGLLVSEPSACPFCVTPDFGVTYDSPPFRRGLAFAGQSSHHPLASATSAMSSSSSLGSLPLNRRRTTSLSASEPRVITTDRVRPDWAKKLSDARAQALRRSAAATALHNAAYVLGNASGSDTRNLVIGRRRRTFFGESPSASGSGTPRLPDGVTLSSLGVLLAHAERQSGQNTQGDTDLYAGRTSSRRNRVDDLEELMMMEAIRMSLASEDDRKKREDKESKKEDKKKAKEAKKAEKAARKSGASLYPANTNDSSSTWSSMARSSSNIGQQPSSPASPLSQSKGKAPAMSSVGFNPLSEPSSTLNTEMAESSSVEDPQRHLEASRAALPSSQPIPLPSSAGSTANYASHLRHISNTSSIASSLTESAPTSFHNDESGFGISPNASGLDVSSSSGVRNGETPPNASTGPLEPMFNFRSLAAMIDEEEKKGHEADHVEHVDTSEGSAISTTIAAHAEANVPNMPDAADDGQDVFEEARTSLPPPAYPDGTPIGAGGALPHGLAGVEDAIMPVSAERAPLHSSQDQKHGAGFKVLDAPREAGTTQ